MSKDKFEDQEENFADLLEQSFSEMKTFEPGEAIEAIIISISENCVFLELNGKSEGMIDIAELTDKDGNITVKTGDKIKAFFESSKNGAMNFTTKISGAKAGKAVLENAFKSEIPVEGLVEKEIKGGFEVKIGDARAFCPFSQMGQKRVEDAASYIGKNLTFKILEHSENGRNILVSNRAILEEENQKKRDLLKETLQENMTVKGTVTSLQDFGAFVDISGVQALLPISEISRTRVNDINKSLTIGDEIEAVIIKLDWKNNRITLSMKTLMSDPWDEVQTKYTIGSRYSGVVARITNFGAFVTLEPGLDGLIHISDLEGDLMDKNSSETLKSGQTISVRINSIDIEKKRMSLKPVSSTQEDEDYKKYMEDEDDTDTYNPFAALLKDKVKKPGKKK